MTETDSTQEQTLAEQAPSRFECRSCGYVYEPTKGDNTNNIPPGTRFEDLPPSWRCPVCGVRRPQFRNIGSVGAPSGFQENLDFGFGINRLTPGQKNLLIFGGLALGVLFFLSLYGLR
ncbi:MAG: rubredoxin [Jaaginema sp. PMC 1079.18]|nr:rubredoxin [Jaaginema sp. PMC 1080.18]MEC4849709.1 rubredoxin [Jaaginema sp. PMC 1079.18]MEC4864862.1 rubredoxin [Jaaginema sp. PMC 1078.18]